MASLNMVNFYCFVTKACARRPGAASSAQRSRRLRSTLAAAPVLLAHAEVTKIIIFSSMDPKLRYPAVGSSIASTAAHSGKPGQLSNLTVSFLLQLLTSPPLFVSRFHEVLAWAIVSCERYYLQTCIKANTIA